MITLGFKYSTNTLDGVDMTEAFRRIEAEGADIIGLNCFRDPQRMLTLAAQITGAVKCPIATQPVAYRCTNDKPYFQIQLIGEHPAFPLELDSFTLSRIEMAEYASESGSGIFESRLKKRSPNFPSITASYSCFARWKGRPTRRSPTSPGSRSGR